MTDQRRPLPFLQVYKFFEGSEHIRAKLTHFPTGKTWTGVWVNIADEEEECFAITRIGDAITRIGDQYDGDGIHNFRMVSDRGLWLTFPSNITRNCILIVEGDQPGLNKGEADGS